MAKVYALCSEGSQYWTNNNCYEDNIGEVDAIYISQSEPSYQKNLLIEALPPVRKDIDVYFSMKSLPVFDISERQNDDVYRMDAIMRLSRFIIPLPYNLLVDRYLSLVLRNGYVGKHINTKEFNDRLRESSSKLGRKSSGLEAESSIPVVKDVSISQNFGFSIIGISGGGKSTALESSMKYYPKVIRHYSSENEKFLFTQIPIIKIDCSNDGSIKGICTKFFREIDYLLGTQYFERYTKRNVSLERMIDAIAHLSQYYALGALVIDEIQHLKSTKSGDKALNFFVSLMNQTNVPIIFIGTYKAFNNVLNKDFRQGRRSSGLGTIAWKFMDEEQEFDFFIKNLWEYQWVRNYSELSDDIKKLIYKKSLGITDRIVKLFMISQLEAIVDESEELTYELIEKVSDERFVLTKHMIDAFERKDLKILASLEDMVSPDIDQVYYEALDNKISIQQIADFANNELKKRHFEQKQKYDDLIRFGLLTEPDYKKVNKVALKVITELPVDAEIKDMRIMLSKYLLGYPQNDNKDNPKSGVDQKTAKKKSNRKDRTKDFNVDDFVGEYVGKDDSKEKNKKEGNNINIRSEEDK